MPHIESLTTAVLSTALDAASLRQQVISANIANAGRSDYVAQKVSFEATLNEMMLRSDSSRSSSERSPIELRMSIEPDTAADGSTHAVQLDAEMGALAQNSVHYQALVRGLNKLMSVMASAVTEGKR